MTLEQFFDALKYFDWYYSFSDDGGVYRRGAVREEELRRIGHTSPAHQRMIDDWSKHMFTGESWNTPRAPEPVLSNYLEA